MTTKIDMQVAEDAFEANKFIKLNRSNFGETVSLSVVDWAAKRVPQDVALSEILLFVYREMRTRMQEYDLWLLLGDTLWQNDTRIMRYMKKFNSLKAQGLDFGAFENKIEFMIESQQKLKFFGAVQIDEVGLTLVPRTMQPGSCTYLLALPSTAPSLPERTGWTGRLIEDSELIDLSVKNDGIIFQRVGFFDDPEVGLIALGKPDIVMRLTA